MPRSRLVLVVLLAAVVRAGAQDTQPADAPAVRQAPQPALSLRKAQLLGVATGLALGAALARRPESPVPALRPLRGIDAILTGSAAALYLGGELVERKRSEPDPTAAAAVAAAKERL